MALSAAQRFLKEYERQTNTHDFKRVAPLIHKKASYWFTDGSFFGRTKIKQAFERTWDHIKEEKYRIRDVKQIASSRTLIALCYRFEWRGLINGKMRKGVGRGTTVLIWEGKRWKVLHEHLSR